MKLSFVPRQIEPLQWNTQNFRRLLLGGITFVMTMGQVAISFPLPAFLCQQNTQTGHSLQTTFVIQFVCQKPSATQ